jgi:hypothetical protein
MASGLSGGVYQPPVRSVNFNFGTGTGLVEPAPGTSPINVGIPGAMPNNPFPVSGPIGSLPPAGMPPSIGEIGALDPLPGGGMIGGVGSIPIGEMPLGPIGGGPSGIGSIDWTDGSGIVTQPGGDPVGYQPIAGLPDYSTGDSSLQPIVPPSFVTGPDAPPPPAAMPSDPSYLDQLVSGVGSVVDFLGTNAGNPYQPTTGNMNDPGYAWDWTTTGDAGGVGHQLAGLLNMGVITGGGGGFGSGSGEGGSGFVAGIGGGLDAGNMITDPNNGFGFNRSIRGLL